MISSVKFVETNILCVHYSAKFPVENDAVCSYHSEDGGSKVLRNIGILPHN